MARRRPPRFDFYNTGRPKPPPSPTALRERLGREPNPVRPVGDGRKLTKTFWGTAWCDNLDRYEAYASRLSRGRSYLRDGRVIDLMIERGRVTALVLGTDLYLLMLYIEPLSRPRRSLLEQRCTGQLGSVVDLLAGRLPLELMHSLTEVDAGLFPTPAEISMHCSCFDAESPCKHLAAVLYGVGVLLDAQPELLFALRGVEVDKLLDTRSLTARASTRPVTDARRIPASELTAIFGVLIDDGVAEPAAPTPAPASPIPAPLADSLASRPIASSRKWITDAELAERGLTDAQVREWIRDGHLLVVTGNEGYRLLPEARRRLRAPKP